MDLVSQYGKKRILLILFAAVLLNVYLFYTYEPKIHYKFRRPKRNQRSEVYKVSSVYVMPSSSARLSSTVVINDSTEVLNKLSINNTQILSNFNDNSKEIVEIKTLGDVDEGVSRINNLLKHYVYYYLTKNEDITEKKKLCHEISITSPEVVYKLEQDAIESGGYYNPPECVARHNIAVIIPYVKDVNHLENFIHHIHPILVQQQLEYQIFVVEENSTASPKIGQLLNIGVIESLKFRQRGWDCFLMHSMLLLPKKHFVMYKCGPNPRQLFIPVSTIKKSYFGGAIALTLKQLMKVNGFSNVRTSADIVYNDMYQRLKVANYTIEENFTYAGNYLNLEPNNYEIMELKNPSNFAAQDGLINVTYEVTRIKMNKLYTHIVIQDRKSKNR